MAMKSLIRGVRGGGSGEEVTIKAERSGALHVNQALPPYTLLTALGKGYMVYNTNVLPALVVRPSTLAMLTLWNGESGGGLSYIIDRVYAHQIVSGTGAESRWGIWLMIHPVGTGSVDADLTTIDSLRGIASYGGNARADNADAVADHGWHPWGDSVDVEPTTVLPGSQKDVRPEGRIVIPPGSAISVTVVASTVDEDFHVGIQWYEAQLDLA